MIKIGVLKETAPENRVSVLPAQVGSFVKQKAEVWVEENAGELAFSSDEQYREQGAKIVSRTEILAQADILLSINPPKKDELQNLKPEQLLIGVLQPLSNLDLVSYLVENKISSFSMDSIPRITRAQDKDILSSMATVTGYKAVLDAAMHLPQFFPMFMTAAGTIKPAKVLVLGAGVAGLQAIATARRLGAQVEAFDVRSEVKEQVESLGAKFVMIEGAKEDKTAGGYAVEQTEEYKQKQQALVQLKASQANVVITTAQIPGRKAPILITSDTVQKMKAGSVIVDLAASSGGNCELSENDKIVQKFGVTIIGKTDYPTSMPLDASQMYGRNVYNFIKLMIDKDGNINLDWNDEIINQTCITHKGEIMNERVKSLFNNTLEKKS
jgi:NAD(P) transhydrogenase subunit alpha